jgi:hypothetical protein
VPQLERAAAALRHQRVRRRRRRAAAATTARERAHTHNAHAMKGHLGESLRCLRLQHSGINKSQKERENGSGNEGRARKRGGWWVRKGGVGGRGGDATRHKEAASHIGGSERDCTPAASRSLPRQQHTAHGTAFAVPGQRPRVAAAREG